MKFILRLMLLVGMTATLTACFGPKTPQEVTQAFWEAVVSGDTKDVVEYSTLADAKLYDGFAKEWAGFQPSWGKVIIEGNEASVVSEFSSPANSGMEDRKFVTYLVQRSEAWKVDYDRTGVEVRGGALTNLFGKLSQLGDDLSKQLQMSANDFNAEMERMSQELETMSEEFGQQASDSIERYAEELRESLKELEASIGRALKEDNNTLSEQDRRLLEEASSEVDESRDRLAEPTLESIAISSKSIGSAQRKLGEVEGSGLDEYRQQWQELSQKLEKELQKIIDELSSSRG